MGLRLLEAFGGLTRCRPVSGAWQIDITTRCALTCRMCIRRGLPGWESADMSREAFSRLLPLFEERGVAQVVLQGWGEPLLHPDLVWMVDAVKHPAAGARRGRGARDGAPAVGFVTGATGLDRPLATALADAGLDFAGVSLAGVRARTHEAIRCGSSFDAARAGAAHLAAARRRDGQRPRVHLVYLLLKDNIEEVVELPRLARSIGAGAVVLTNLVHVSDDWQEGQRVFDVAESPEYERLLEAAEREAAACGIPLLRPRLVAGTVPVCAENPLANLYVTPRGEVAPCVYLSPPVPSPFRRIFRETPVLQNAVHFGNLFDRPFAGIWDDPGYAAFREAFRQRQRRGTAPPAPCRTCHKMLGL